MFRMKGVSAKPDEPSVLSPWSGGARTQVIGREASELESFSSATTEKDNDQKARRQDRRHHWRDRRDWGGYWKTFRQRGCLWWLYHSQRLCREGLRYCRLRRLHREKGCNPIFR